MGYDDDYWKRAGNDGWYVSNSRFDGPYGDYDGLFMEYILEKNGWSLTFGAEDAENSGEAGQPDVYGGLSYAGGGWYLAGIVYRDSSASSEAWKVRADYDMGAFVEGLAVGGWYMSDDGKTDYVKGHAVGLTGKMNLAKDLVLFGGYGKYDDGYYNKTGVCGVGGNGPCGTNTGYMTWTAGLAWEVVSGLSVQPEYETVVFDAENGTSQRNHGLFNLKILRSF